MKAIKRLFVGDSTAVTPQPQVAPEVEKKVAPIPDDELSAARQARDTQRRLAGRGRSGTALTGGRSNNLG